MLVKRRKFVNVSFMKEVCHASQSAPSLVFSFISGKVVAHLLVECLAPVVAAGFCAHGLAGAGGMGRLVAEWIIDGRPGLDAWEMDSRRFGRHYISREYTLARTTEVNGSSSIRTGRPVSSINR